MTTTQQVPHPSATTPPTRSRRRLLVAVAASAAVLGSGAGATAALMGTGPDAAPGTVLLHGDSRLPSTTAQDWVTYADHVLVVRPTTEVPVDVSGGQDGGLGMRSVTTEVVGVLWSAPSAAAPAPTTLDLLAVGTQTLPDGRQLEAAMEGVPRLEVGHTYLAAVSWVAARCSPGDTPAPAHFEPLGEHALVAYDKQVVGQGEVAGEVVSAERAAQAASGVSEGQRSVADQVAGKPSSALVSALAQAAPTTRQVFTVPAPCP